MTTSPYHAGEQAMQRKANEEIPAYRNGRIIADQIIPGAIPFMEAQPFVIVSSQDRKGGLWTSILSGEGYLKVNGEKTLCLDTRLLHSNPGDCWHENTKNHPFTGMLFIDLSTRRRYRVNGQTLPEGEQVVIHVQQAYANCPKYIQRRRVTTGRKPLYGAAATKGTALTVELTNWIKMADTFFVGSSNGAGALDASHRGGNPGFVGVVDPFTLHIPDYEGNSMYNTLGNFLLHSGAGLLFIDVEAHCTLQLSGKAEVCWNSQAKMPAKAETGLYWTFTVEEWVLLENLKDAQWTFLDYCPFNPS